MYPERVNIETIQFIGVLNHLAESSKNGFKPFSDVHENDPDILVYDDKDPIKIVNTPYDSFTKYPLVADYLAGMDHHDIISTYTNMWKSDGIRICVIICEDSDPFIQITSDLDNDFCIVVEHGIWHNA